MRFIVNIPIENTEEATRFLKRALQYYASIRYREQNYEETRGRGLSASESIDSQTGITIDGIELSKL